jgi:uncharacterized protein (TIGR03083 family)
MHIDHGEARDAFRSELDRLLDLAEGLSDHDLLAVSRCRGWTVGDVLTHVHIGLQEMVLGLLSPVGEPATVDAASYWASAPPTNDEEVSETDHVRYVRLLGSAYRRPIGGIRHLLITGRTLSRAAATTPERNLSFQGHVLRTGDFFATWAVELAVHHLDLGPELTVEPPTGPALELARRTVTELAGGPLPTAMTDPEVILIGTGRLDPPADLDLASLRLPAFG